MTFNPKNNYQDYIKPTPIGDDSDEEQYYDASNKNLVRRKFAPNCPWTTGREETPALFLFLSLSLYI